MYVPDEWLSEVENAMVNHPKYLVHNVKIADILDFKTMANDVLQNREVADDGGHISWLDVHQFQYRKQHPTTVFFKYSLDEGYRSFNITGRRRRQSQCTLVDYQAELLYAGVNQQAISDAKAVDLRKLCRDGHIPSRHHAFYTSLWSNSEVPCTLDDP